MLICPSCGRENAEDARFCSGCATPLGPEAPAREERKVVTCLFCDLVGFTARAEQMDPEDVRRLLQPYHSRVRSELERFGGTVEKFIGDAVMAVFGAPIAHEDDPERAVRAALAIREALAEAGELEIRIGITTGEALIALGARPEVGEGMASGDVVNTAARIQAAAPVGSVLVDETTYRATERAIEYGKAEPIEAKGKTSAISVWDALRARARVGVERVGGAPLVGREQELTLLRETFARVTRERRSQLLTLVGVPGIGKSRLVFELFQTIESGDFGLVFWRHGRSLPYGDGVTFWALSEMVKAQAGILESDTPEDADEKLRQAVARFVPDAAEAGWVERHLRPLAGLETDETWTADRRTEAFAAWRRFFEALAETRPLVLVFEDLHWADEALLDFVDHLVDWASGVPILALCTARPELLARRPVWGGGKVNSSTILLSPLSEEETTALVHALLGRSVIDAGVQARLLEHAGGNPLYAEEFTRMLAARPGETILPETVQGIIAARLDTLPREEKELLQDAAVLGRVFWLGALGRERWRLEERLHSLERKEFVSRQRRTSVAGEDEYAFRHALVRDVAYEQIPKSERADKHFASAEWIESLGRTEDHAEMLAHHYGTAFDYARAADQDTSVFAERGRAALRDAGDRAFALNAFAPAARFYERALELWPAEDRAEVLLHYGRTLHVLADERCTDVLEAAAHALLEAGKQEHAAEAHAFLTDALHQQGSRDRAFEHLERALMLVSDAPASPANARVLTEASRVLTLGDQPSEGLAIGQEAFEMAEELDLTELSARALNNVGVARWALGDYRGGIADLERSVELGLAVGSPEAARGYHNLASIVWFLGELPRSTELFEKAAQVGERLGGLRQSRASRAVLCSAYQITGAWEEALRGADTIIAEGEAGTPSYFDYHPRLARSWIRLARDDSAELVVEDLYRAIEVMRSVKDLQVLVPVLSAAAFVFAVLGRLAEADEAAQKLLDALEAAPHPANVHRALPAAWFAEAFGYADRLRDVIGDAGGESRWLPALGAVLDGDYERGAEILAAMGHVDAAYARLRAAEKLLTEGRPAEADAQLQNALAFYRSVGAARYVREGEALLAAAS